LGGKLKCIPFFVMTDERTGFYAAYDGVLEEGSSSPLSPDEKDE